MKLNVFCPLPPAKTEIANNFLCQLPALAQLAELTIWTDQDAVESNVRDFGDVRRYDLSSLDFVALNSADATIYHLGNNAAFHASILQASQQFPGIIILHDLVLHGLYLPQGQVTSVDVEQYCQVLLTNYGECACIDYEFFQQGTVTLEDFLFKYPLYQPVLSHALAAVVHNSYAFNALVEGQTCPVACIPLPYQPVQTSKYRDAAGGTCRLIMFGHIGASRRLYSVLDALSTLIMQAGLHLDVVGNLWDEAGVRQYIHAKGLSQVVTIHGFVTETELDRLLNEANLAINLRYPTMGETSASQLRIWEHSLPSLVTRTGWYAELPEDIVAFVRPDFEGQDIVHHLISLMRCPEQFAAMGKRGHDYLREHHSPMTYAQDLLRFATKTQEFHGRYMANYLSKRTGQLLSAWLTPENGNYCIGNVARRIAELHSFGGDSTK